MRFLATSLLRPRLLLLCDRPRLVLHMVLFLILVLNVLVAGSLPAQEGLPPWFQNNMTRESQIEKTVSFETPDRSSKGSVAARSVTKPELDGDGDHYLEFDVGSQSAVGCFLFGADIDLGGTITAMTNSTIEAQAAQAGKLQAKQILHLDTGAIDASPFVALESIYVIATETSPQLGYLKARVARKAGRGIYCGHNEVGYRDTFEKSFESLVRNLQPPGEDPAPTHVEIHRTLINGQAIGVDVVHLYPQEDGTTRYLEQGVSLLPLDGSRLQVSDEQTEGVAAADGTTIEESAIEMVNGELVANLNLARTGDGYTVVGESKGQPFEASLDRGPTSPPGEILDFRRLVSDTETRELEHREWDAADSPGALLEMTASVVSRAPDGARVTLSGMGAAFAATLDSNGSVTYTEATIEGNKLEIERVYVSRPSP